MNEYMGCSKCRNKAIPDVEYAGNHYCESHFLQLMDKRVRKNLRINRLLDVKEEYVLVDDGSPEAKITEYFLKEIFKGYLKMKVVKKPLKNKNIILATNLDEQVLLFLDYFLKDEKAKVKNAKKNPIAGDIKIILPLEVLMQKEVELICKILKLKFKPRVKKDVLAELEKKYPGTKFSAFQSKINLIKKNILL